MEQLSIFDMDESKLKIYEVLEDNGLTDTIQSYYQYLNHYNQVKYFYIRTTDNKIIDLCVSSDSRIFAQYESLSDIAIKKLFHEKL